MAYCVSMWRRINYRHSTLTCLYQSDFSLFVLISSPRQLQSCIWILVCIGVKPLNQPQTNAAFKRNCSLFDRRFGKNRLVTEWDKVWSRLSSHLQPFFLAHSAYFNNFRQNIPYFDVSRQKRVLFNCFARKQCLGMPKM